MHVNFCKVSIEGLNNPLNFIVSIFFSMIRGTKFVIEVLQNHLKVKIHILLINFTIIFNLIVYVMAFGAEFRSMPGLVPCFVFVLLVSYFFFFKN